LSRFEFEFLVQFQQSFNSLSKPNILSYSLMRVWF